MYKFIKVRNKKAPNLKYDNWYLYCDNIETLLSHNDIIIKSEIDKSINEVICDVQSKSKFAKTIDDISETLGNSYLVDALKLNDDAFNNKIKYILSNNILLLTSSLSYMFLDGFEIIDTIEKDILDFNISKFTETDIKIVQWKAGDHYYAKIGNYDVVIDNEQKWNSFDEAYSNALKYLSEF